MGRPKSKNPKNITLRFRVTKAEANRIAVYANAYAKGKLCDYLRHQCLMGPRSFVSNKTKTPKPN